MVGWVPSLGSPLLSVRTGPVWVEVAVPWLTKVWLAPLIAPIVTSKRRVWLVPGARSAMPVQPTSCPVIVAAPLVAVALAAT